MNLSIQSSHLILTHLPQILHWARTELRNEISGELTLPQLRMMGLVQQGISSASELSEWSGITLPATTRMVAHLVSKNLIQKKTLNTDRRKTLLSLTPIGHKKLNQIQKKLELRLATHMKKLAPSAVRKLSFGLEELASLTQLLTGYAVKNETKEIEVTQLFE